MQRRLPIMLVDDDPDLRESLAEGLTLAGHKVLPFGDAGSAFAQLSDRMPGAVISDIRMPGMDGRQLLKRIHAVDNELPVILITGHGDIAEAVDAMRQGAYDFVPKPFAVDRLVDCVERALEVRGLVLENRRLRAVMEDAGLDGNGVGARFIGSSRSARRLTAVIDQIGATDVDVLVSGEPGSGKDFLCQLLHARSSRRDRPLISIDCEALPPDLQEIELFGHAGGAGRVRKRIGRIAAANRGTLALHAIEKLVPAVQLRLLRTLESQELHLTGSNEIVAIDIRLVATSAEQIGIEVAEGRFRADLHYRIGAVQLEIPPLRSRRDDIAPLFAHFAGLAARRFKRPIPGVSAAIRAHLAGHDWPGNARELQAFAETVVMGLQPNKAAAQGGRDGLSALIAAYEADVIRATLAAEAGNIQRCCARLGLPRKTLYDKCARHGIIPMAYRS